MASAGWAVCAARKKITLIYKRWEKVHKPKKAASNWEEKVCDTTAMWEVRQINIYARLFIAQGIHNKLPF